MAGYLHLSIDYEMAASPLSRHEFQPDLELACQWEEKVTNTVPSQSPRTLSTLDLTSIERRISVYLNIPASPPFTPTGSRKSVIRQRRFVVELFTLTTPCNTLCSQYESILSNSSQTPHFIFNQSATLWSSLFNNARAAMISASS